jgi:hypothetical protein
MLIGQGVERTGRVLWVVVLALDRASFPGFAVNSLSQFMVDPLRVHWITAKHVLRYLRGTMEYGLLYERSGGMRLAGFTDVDWAGCAEDEKSTLGFCF